jgi:protein arginine N-methyltransferase 1
MTKSLDEHFGYLSDPIKVETYQAAIAQAVQPGHVVVDLGCGSGLLGLMALKAGAARVLFIEETEIIEVARKTVADAGFAEKSEFLRGNSFELTLPERVDVVVCDHVGYFGFDYGIPALLADARERFLKPDGILVPAQVEILMAPVESEASRALVQQWRDESVPNEFTWLGTTSANTKHPVQLNQQDLLANSATLAALEMGVSTEPYLSWQTGFSCLKSGLLDGVAGWFDCRLFGDIRMTNSPTVVSPIDRPQAFLPLDTPVKINEGETIQVTLMVRPLDHVTAWIIELPASGKRFSHTTFDGMLLDPETLMRARADRVARLNKKGRARQVVLSYCDGQRTVAEIQALVLHDHPDLFPSETATSSFVQRVLSWDTSE